MKQLSGLIIFLFCAFISYGQIPNKVKVSNDQTQYQIPNVFAMLSAKLPVVDTLNNKATPYPGALTILPADTLFHTGIPPIYISNGVYWSKISGGGGGSGVDSITFPINPPQICVWSGGVSTCYNLNQYYDSTSYNGDSTYYYHYSNGSFVDSVWIPFTHVYQGQATYFKDTTYNGRRAQVFNAETQYVTPDSLYLVTLNGDGSIKDSIQWTGLSVSIDSGRNLVSLNTTTLQSALRYGRVTAIVTDIYTGGAFNYSSDLLIDDYGITFPAADGGHWVRDISQATMTNVWWFRVLPANTYAENDAAISAMLTALPASATIYVPNGTINHSGINITKRVNIRGQSRYAARLINVGTGTTAINIAANVERCNISNIAIWGNGTLNYGTDATTGYGIVFHNFCAHWNLDNIWMRGHGDAFIYADSTGNINNLNITNSQLEMGKTSAIHLVQKNFSNQINAVMISGCNISTFGTNGLELWGTTISVENNTIQACYERGIIGDGGWGYNPSGMYDLRIENNYFELCDMGFIYLRAMVVGASARYISSVRIEGNYGSYNNIPADTIDQSSHSLVEIAAPFFYSPYNIQVSAITYLTNEFSAGVGVKQIQNIFNGNNVLTFNSVVQKSLASYAYWRKYTNLGYATVIGEGYLSGPVAPQNTIRAPLNTVYRCTTCGVGFGLWIKDTRITPWDLDSSGWVPVSRDTSSFMHKNYSIDETVTGKKFYTDDARFYTNITVPKSIGGINANDSAVFIANTAASGHTLTNVGFGFDVGDSGLTRAMSITHNGNVGIGTTSANQRLTVELNNTSTSLTNGSLISVANTDTTDNNISGISLGQANSGLLIQGAALYAIHTSHAAGNRSSDFAIGTSTGNALTQKFIIKGDGKVGVGVASPASIFSVGTNSEFQVNSSGNIVKLNNATTSFPSSNSAGVLTNNGSGTLTWGAAGGSGTVTSIATGLGLSGGTITTTGTLLVDTSSVSILSRQRAASTYLPLAGGLVTGNVGIGASSAPQRLTVEVSSSGTTVASGNMVSIVNTDVTDNNITGLSLGQSSSSLTVQGAALYAVNTSHTGGSRASDLAIATSTANALTEKIRILGNGRVGIRFTAPTASLHLPSGSTTASSAPIKLAIVAPALNTTAEKYAVEVDSTTGGGNIYYTNASATRYYLTKTLTNTATLDFGNTSAQTSASLTITVTGAATDDAVAISVPTASFNANSNYTAYVSATNTVTIVFNNYSSGAIDPASGSFRVSVLKY